MTLPLHTAIRYAAPLREGGSLPAIVDTHENGMWVVKFVGAGQGARALVAEILVAEIARTIALPVPEIALIDIPPNFGRTEADPEIQDLLRASHGVNVGLRYLDGAFNFDPVAASDLVDPAMAAEVVWLDAFVTNIDRTPRNPNMMVHGDGLWLIDHGAALYFHHAWGKVSETSMRRGFQPIENHVLMPHAGSVTDADARITARLDVDALAAIVARLPDELLLHAPEGTSPAFETADEFRDAYRTALSHRLRGPRDFVDVAESARRRTQENP
mgnify:CR=1 FL=1